MFHFLPAKADADFYGPDPDSPRESVQKIKAAVRERDGFRCQDCGMTTEEHMQKHETALHVHRIVPELEYAAYWCVTLCQSCHAKKPRKAHDAFWADDIRWFGLNLYDERDRHLWQRIKAACEQGDVYPTQFLYDALEKHLEGRPPDYCI